MEILSSGVADLSCSLNRCASMISRSHPWRTRPSATSLSLQTRSTSSWVAIMRTEKITSAMMVEKSKTDFFVCVSILFVCKIRFRFVNWFFCICSHELHLLFPYFSRTFSVLFTYFFRTLLYFFRTFSSLVPYFFPFFPLFFAKYFLKNQKLKFFCWHVQFIENISCYNVKKKKLLPLRNWIWDSWTKWSFFVTDRQNLPIIYRFQSFYFLVVGFGNYHRRCSFLFSFSILYLFGLGI